jgi:hypothetical protein
MAFKRSSVEKATEWHKHKDEYLQIKKSNDSECDPSQSAYWAMVAAAALGIYV